MKTNNPKKTRRKWPQCKEPLKIRGRSFNQTDLVRIRDVIRKHPTWGRTRISQFVAQILGWRQSDGRLKERACRVALLHLQRLGYIDLPQPKSSTGGRPPHIVDLRCFFKESKCLTEMPERLEVRFSDSSVDRQICSSSLHLFHYLGAPRIVGRNIRYLLYGDEHLLGTMIFGEPAWSVEARDKAFKYVQKQQHVDLDAIVGNQRFLILPWVKVPNLASRMLSLAIRKLSQDWQKQYSITPILCETFVDSTLFHGTCYKAANWIEFGSTKGYMKRGADYIRHDRPKKIFMRGLTSDIHKRLTLAKEQLDGRRSQPASETTRRKASGD